MKLFDSKADVDHVAAQIDNGKIAENDYNLSVSGYIEAKDTREQVDITQLNQKRLPKLLLKIVNNCALILVRLLRRLKHE